MATELDRQALAGVKEDYKYGWAMPEKYAFKSEKGLNHEVIDQISDMKNEPDWMREFRHKALDVFLSRPTPTWGADLSTIDFDDIYYYIKPAEKQGKNWDDVPSEIKETFDRLGIPEAERKFLAGVGAQYECLTGDARVYTARGLKPIAEVEAGDTVFSFDEAQNAIITARVTGKAAKGEREVFEVRVGTRTIKATSNHPFLVLDYQKAPGKQAGRYRRQWKYLQDLQPGDLVAVAKRLPEAGEIHAMQQPEIKTQVVGRNQSVEYTLDISERYNAISLPEHSSDDLLWWLGLYMGDGFIHTSQGADKARIEFAIPETDKPLRQELVRTTEALFGITPVNGNPDRMTVYSTKLARYLETNGMGGKALSKRVPAWMYTLPESQKLAFLGGYIDSDGYVRDAAKNHDIVLTSGNSALLQDVRDLAAMSGLPASNIHRFESKHPVEPERAVVGYRLQLAGDFERIPVRSPQRRDRLGKRKYHHSYTSAHGTTFRVHANDQVGFAKIDAITPAGVEMVYDIEVAGPHNFVAEGLIVHNSEVVYHSLKEEWQKQGVLFLDTDTALREHPDLFKKYFGTIIPPTDNKFAALNSAVWSGGSFIYMPPGVHIEIPLQAYFRINAANMGQFERTLIIVDEGASMHYIEGCTAPTYSSDSLHSAVVEIIVHKNGRCRYTTIQNWSNNVYNLVTKRAVAYENATMEWIDGNLGCLAEGSLVTTPAGVKPIEQLNVGEEVLSFDESAGQLGFRRVAAKRFSGYQPVQTVAIGERKLRVTANHPFYSYVYDAQAAKKLGRYQLAYVRADHLQEAIVPRTSIAYGQPHQLQLPALVTDFVSGNQYVSGLNVSRTRDSRLMPLTETTDEIMWLFGYWLGDGNIEVQAGRTEGVMRWAKVGFSTPVQDRARERLLQTMTAVTTAEPVERTDGNHLAWHSTELAEFFQVNGFGGSAASKRVPQWVSSLPESQRLAFIAGYLDADGTVQAPRSFTLKSVNRELLEDAAGLLVTLGITPRLYTEFDEPRRVVIAGIEATAHGSHRLSFPIDARLFAHISPRLRQQAEDCQPARLQHHRRVGRSQITLPEAVEIAEVSVSASGAVAEPTWDIEVEGTGNFVAQGFIVHNSKITMKYPAVYMLGERAHGEVLSIAFAGHGQHQDAGGKVVHGAPNTSSKIISKSISKDGGRASYRGLLKVAKGAKNSKSTVVCDALLLDERSRSDTYPYIEIDEDAVEVGHEASVSKIGEEQLFYLTSRGISEDEAAGMIVGGFIEPLVKELPMEYAVEMNRLIQLQMEGSIG